MSASETISGSAITSPAKLAFAGYVLLAYKGTITTTNAEFFIVAGLFFFLQMLHDDYLRIRPNLWGERNWPFQSLGGRSSKL
jgi:hypothetical protein